MANKRSKSKQLSPEEINKSRIESDMRTIREHLDWGILPLNPTRKFNAGERVRWGAISEVYIVEQFEDGLYYSILCKNVKRSNDVQPMDEIHIVEWHELYPLAIGNSNFTVEEKYRIRLSNTSLESIIHMIYHPGVDSDVEYQRDHVWTIDDKVALIDSIFNNIDIGKFVFIQRDYSYIGKLYEVVDGKQRLNALQEFFEDRFPYKGVYYSQLSTPDRRTFLHYGVTYGYLENPNKRAIFESFIKLNTTGRPMENKDIDRVKKLLSELGD